MKLALAFSLLLILPAAAQRKIWTWTPPAPTEQVGHQIIKAVSAPTGLTAIVYSEINFGPPGSSGGGFKAVLISPSGVLLASREVTTFTHYGPEQLWGSGGKSKWKAAQVAKNSIVLSDGTRLLKFSLSGKAGAITEQIADYFEGEEFVPIETNAATFSGWLKTKGVAVGEISANPQHEPFSAVNRLTSIELWSAK